jgi:hypothetical protein
MAGKSGIGASSWVGSGVGRELGTALDVDERGVPRLADGCYPIPVALQLVKRFIVGHSAAGAVATGSIE